MEDQFELEELELDDSEELEELLKLTHSYWELFPCITVSDHTLYFNRMSNAIVPKRLKWFATSELIIGLPASEVDVNSFAVKNYAGTSGKATRFPSFMQQKKIKRGVYKLYKYKDGFAFKRYEPIIGRE